MEAASGVKSIVARAQRAAQKRGQSVSTAHLLLVMLQQGGPLSGLLSAQGMRESDLLNALKIVDPETASTLDRALERATQLATRTGHGVPTSWHLLLAITRDARSAGHRSLSKMGLGPGRVHDEILQHLGGTADSQPELRPHPEHRAPERPKRPLPEPRAPRRILQASRPVNVKRPEGDEGRPPIRTAALRTPTRSAPTRTSPARNKPRPRVPARPSARRGAEPTHAPKNRAAAHPIALRPAKVGLDPELFPTLAALGRDLTALAAAGELDPVFGRDAEIEALLDVLARRRSNNPLLVGPPGVGKTAVVEGLARLLVRGEGGLGERFVIEISAGALVSGTGVRGALSKKITALREEVARSEGRVVLFIDEIHAIVGSQQSGPDDLAHELKAALARGELPCIGATTDREYRQHFERDPALARRFSAITVAEPSPADAVRILEGIAPRYEVHHEVEIDREALEAAVALSVRFLPERHLPDKAIGVLDLAAARTRRRGGEHVGREAVAAVIAERTGVPLDRLMMRDGERLLVLEDLLHERVVGHGAAMTRIADSLRKGAAGFRGKRPLGTFLFLGPTGVGKTETAKAIADVFFPGTPMTRLDMSEMGEAHAVARLLGAPPGYIGHDDGGQLTEAVRRRPYQLVLLDEIEKAHPEVLLALLPLLDEGRLTDGRGRTVDFCNTIVVMTSNLGVQVSARRSIGFGDVSELPGDSNLAAARAALPPELWNRIDEPLWFAALGRDEVAVIAGRMLAGVAARLAERRILLRVEASAIDALIVAGGYDAALGARPMRRLVGRLVEAPLASALLGGSLVDGCQVVLEGEGAEVRYRVETASAA